jgi:predicted phage terminase large subunit-like protein
VLFPAWVWAQSPGESFILCSYSDSLSEELNMARRALLQSAWFQETFPGKVLFSPDQNRREQFKNLAGGQAIATSTEGTLTGKGGDYLLIDDLLSPQQSYSDLERQNANRFFDSTLRSRLNEPATGRIIVICQRLHEADLVGYLAESEPGAWQVLNLPMECEQDEVITFPISGRVIHRTAGDLLHPQRWPKVWVDKQKRTIGRVVWSSQYQQRPSPKEGNLVKVSDIMYYGGKDLVTGEKDPDLPADFERRIISVDAAFKDKSSSDYVCILVIGVVGARRYVLHIVNSHLNLDGTENEIRAAHANFGPISCVLVEDKANGVAVVSHLTEEIPGVIAVDPRGGKFEREAHNWFFDRTGAWTNKAIDQLCLFPNAKNDDIADAVSQAAIWLQSHSYALTLVDYIKKTAVAVAAGVLDVFGARRRAQHASGEVAAARTPAQTRVENYEKLREKPEVCPVCGMKALGQHPDGHFKTLCRQCGAVNGVIPVVLVVGSKCPVAGCDLAMQWSGGVLRCQNHGQPPASGNPPRGVTRKQAERLRGQFALGDMDSMDAKIGRSFGRYGW